LLRVVVIDVVVIVDVDGSIDDGRVLICGTAANDGTARRKG